nr:integrase, catalytic region, zinc finger, CCHC-type, peptidase aspartic, catalytic [Tanacetum cinerariifolium]
MANLSEDIQCAGSDTQPPMLDRTDFASWQQRIQLYCQEKENRVNILKSIDEVPFQMGTFRETIAEYEEGAFHLGPERARVYSDLSPKDKREKFKDKMLLMQAQENRVVLDEEPLLFIAGGQDNAVDEDVDELLVQDLALNVDNVFQADECDAFDFDVDEAPTAQTMFMVNLSSTDPVYNEANPSYDSDILSEVHVHDNYRDAICEHHEVHEMHDDVQPNCVVDSDAKYTGDSSITPTPRTSVAGVLGGYIIKALIGFKALVCSLRAEIDQNAMNMKCDEIERKNLLIENDNLIVDCLSKEVFYIATNSELTVSRFNEMYDTYTVVQARDQTTSLLTENENLKVQLNEKIKRVTMDSIKPKVLAPGMYAIDVEPILPRYRNNREVHLDYLKHLKESVATLRKIVEEGTCLKDFNKRDKKLATTPSNRKTQVTFEDQCETSNNNTQKHIEQLHIQKTNIPVIPFTGVNSCIDASGSKPRSNTKKNRILPAKSVNKKKVEEHPRTNKSSLKNESC